MRYVVLYDMQKSLVQVKGHMSRRKGKYVPIVAYAENRAEGQDMDEKQRMTLWRTEARGFIEGLSKELKVDPDDMKDLEEAVFHGLKSGVPLKRIAIKVGDRIKSDMLSEKGELGKFGAALASAKSKVKEDIEGTEESRENEESEPRIIADGKVVYAGKGYAKKRGEEHDKMVWKSLKKGRSIKEWKDYLQIEKPEKAHADNKISSVGRSKKDGKWYGWSHRAIYGFKTKQQAIKFADSVS